MRKVLRETLYVLAVVLVSLGVVFGAQTAAQATPGTKPHSTVQGASEGGSLGSWRKAMEANGWKRLGHPVEGPNGKVHRYCYINTTPDITFLLCFDGYRDVS